MNRWLVVGAGAVGLAWGWHAARGGAAVTFLVRARHADVLRIGVDVHPPGLASALRFDGFGFATSADAAADADVVVLAMPSTGIDDTQLRSLHAHAPAHAVVLSLPPGTRDLERVRSAMPGRTVLGGLIAMSAWWEPLETDASDGPLRWAFPPLARCAIGGDNLGAARRLAATLRGGGMPAVARRARPSAEAGTTVLLPLVLALAERDWSLRSLAGSPLRGLARSAAREMAAARGQGALGRWLTGLPFSAAGLHLLRAASRVAVPFDFEKFLRKHFTKIAAQNAAQAREWIELGATRGLDMAALRELAGYSISRETKTP